MIYALAVSKVDLGDPHILAIIGAFTLWGIASHAFGAVQDVTADLAAAISKHCDFLWSPHHHPNRAALLCGQWNPRGDRSGSR
jgi:hypothetical protein